MEAAAAPSATGRSCKVPADEQARFRLYLEKGGAMDTLTKALVPLMEEPNGASDVLKRHLEAAHPGAVEEVEALHLEAAELQKKYRAALEENEQLKAKVVFHKMAPEETQHLESTARILKEDNSSVSFVGFQIWDFPGQLDFLDPAFDLEAIFGGAGTLIYVIDAQDDYLEALAMLHLTVSKAYETNPDMNFEVFIHKVDGLSDTRKIETQLYIREQAVDNLESAGLEKLRLSFYLTSIYDYSIFEAFSKVVQKLIPRLPTLENLLNIFILSSGIEKAFLMDVASKIYVATDSSPVDMDSYGLCCDMLDLLIDLSSIYGLKEDGSGCAYDEESMAVIRLNNRSVLYLKEVTKFLALACIVREKNFERKDVIDYNFHCVRKAIQEVLDVCVPFGRPAPECQADAPHLKAEAESDTPGMAV